MLARVPGIPLAFLAFFIVARLCSIVVGAGIPLLVGCIAASIVWSYFRKLDETRLQQLLNPPAVRWHCSLPVSFGIIKDAFDGSFVLRSKSGLSPWLIQREDPSRGIVAALLNIQDLTGEGEPKTIGLQARLTPVAGETDVQLQYQVFSPTDSSLVEEIISHTNWRLRQEVKKHAILPAPPAS